MSSLVGSFALQSASRLYSLVLGTCRPLAYGQSSKPDAGPAAQMTEVDQMRTGEPPMLPPWSTIKSKRMWKVQAAGPVLSLDFTPGGAHVVAVVQSGASGRGREIQVFETKTSQEVILEPQENRPPSYQTLTDSNGNNTGSYRLDLSSSAGQFVLHPGQGFEESILRPDIGGSRLTMVDLFYPTDVFENPDDALITKLQEVKFPVSISPAPQVLPGCDEVFVGVDTEDESVLRVFSWSADDHILRQRRTWDFRGDKITHVEFTRDGRRIVCLTEQKNCRVVDLCSDEQHAIPIPTQHKAEILRTYQNPNGQNKVAVSIWEDVMVFGQYGGGEVDIYSLLGAIGQKVRALCLTKDCEFLAVATDNGFDIFQPRTRRIVQKGLGRGLLDIQKGCFSDDSRYIAVADAGGKTYLFKLSGPQWAK